MFSYRHSKLKYGSSTFFLGKDKSECHINVQHEEKMPIPIIFPIKLYTSTTTTNVIFSSILTFILCMTYAWDNIHSSNETNTLEMWTLDNTKLLRWRQLQKWHDNWCCRWNGFSSQHRRTRKSSLISGKIWWQRQNWTQVLNWHKQYNRTIKANLTTWACSCCSSCTDYPKIISIGNS